MRFCDKLAKLRKANNLTQEQLAERLNVTRQTISKWESGECYPDMTKILSICQILNCKLNDTMDDGVVSEDSNNSTNTSNISEWDKDVGSVKRFLDDFLETITKTYNMFIHMSFKDKLKMIFEMTILGILLYLILMLIQNFIVNITFTLVSVITNIAFRKYITTIVPLVFQIAETILGLTVFFHIFKIRYLDYYVTVTDESVAVQKEEKPIEENVSALNKDKEPKVVIGDPKHKGSSFISGLAKIFLFLIKTVLVVFAVFVAICVVFAIGAVFFCLFNTGKLIKISSLIVLGLALFGFAILYIIFNIIFNHKQPYRILLILFASSLLISGLGVGLFTDNVTKLEITDEINVKEWNSETVELNLNENDLVYILSNKIDYEMDESLDKAIIEFRYPKETKLYYGMGCGDDSTEYYYNLEHDFLELKLMFEDLKNDRINRSYNFEDYLIAKVKCNSKDKERFANLGGY